MSDQSIDTPQALDVAIAAGLQSRRERLIRAVRIQRIRIRAAYGLSACVALCALAAFVAGDPKAAAISAVTACVTFSFTFIAGEAGRKQAVDALRETDQSA
jgi:hypothetical protein